MAYLNFYAEDGKYFFQEANDLPFPMDLLKPLDYIILISRIIGRLVTLFPIEILPLINFILVCLAIAFLCAVTWSNLADLISNTYLKLISCCSIIFLPIINFELLASSSSLHFILLFPATLILINLRNEKSINNSDIFVLALTFLSDPLSIMCLTILAKPENLKNWRLLHSRGKYIYAIIFICVALQGLCSLYTLSMGSRKLNASSLLKTGYLYLDRVVGSSLIPNWGFVNSNDFYSGILSTKIFLRGGVALIIVMGLVFLALHVWREMKTDNQTIYRPIENVIIIILVSASYWLFAGYFFNPEPRYAIFPGLCLITGILVLVDCLTKEEYAKEEYGKKYLMSRIHKSGVFFVSVLFISTWVFSTKPSPIRIVGPTWESELISARNSCNNSKQEFAKLVTLPTLPTTANWFVMLKCDKLKPA